MGKEDLQKVFLLTGLAGVMLTALSLFWSASWALAYFLVSTAALINWVALASVIHGMTSRRPLPLLLGLMVKPLVLLFLLILGVRGLIEVSSFLAGVNTFFAVLFLWMIRRSFPLGGKARREAAPTSEVYG